jgi:DNA gyrase subunit A
VAKRRGRGSTGRNGQSKNGKPTRKSRNAKLTAGRNRKAKSATGDVAVKQLIENSIRQVTLREIAQSRYLNYSMSVITSRALPDVRDGLKPVQRRILYTMHQQRLDHTAKHRKCATVVGVVMGNYHPHGDSAIYDALVRMAQPFSLRMPLIDGSGNFGSIDGDNAAAFRYTECRLMPVAAEVLEDLAGDTVDFKDNYDGERKEPVVLPSRLPNLLVNGSTGIAVGMATNIPPHNLAEVCRALLKLLNDPDVKDYQLVAKDAVQGPDFPTGGQVTNSKEELREIYRTGTGTLRVRGTSTIVKQKGQHTILRINSIPYGVNKSSLVEQISTIIFSSKLPLLLDVKDLSTDDIRIDLQLRKGADPDMVLAYLYKHTQFQTSFGVNMTCLVPIENSHVGTPTRLGLKEVLWHFLEFRLKVVTRRLENELKVLNRRLHILNGFILVFDALDEIIRIIRRSKGKSDAAQKLMKRFPAGRGGLDTEQTDAILELKLYKLAKLEINLILEEAKTKKTRARKIRKLLTEDTADRSNSGRWGTVRKEIEHLLNTYGRSPEGKRRTSLATVSEEPEYSLEDFIIDEDCFVVVTADGWVKRQKQILDLSKSRTREGDRILACVAGSTRSSIAFFSSFGTCYTTRMIEIPPTTGYGEPIQKLFKLKDGERIVSALSFDPRSIGDIAVSSRRPDLCPAIHGFAASSNGYALRFGFEIFAEPSTRTGRRFARPAKGAKIIAVHAISGHETILAVSNYCRAMVCRAEEVNYLSGPGKGVLLIKLAKSDRLLGYKPSRGDRDLLIVETNRGAQKTISTVKYRTTSRGGKGTEIQKNGKIARIIIDEVSAPEALDERNA